jgi:hypothetical protein
MKLSAKAKNIYSQINQEDIKLGDLRKIANEIKKVVRKRCYFLYT